MSHYEVVYYYHERLPDGKWDTNKRHEIKKRIGGPTHEIELEKLAAIILNQLAKRDKLVVDVDVYEYSKKKIAFKEATDGSGIILKNKKFSAGIIAGQLNSEDIQEEEVLPHNSLPHKKELRLLPRNEDASRASNRGLVHTWMIFDPEIPMLHEAKQKGLRFTVEKKYPVYGMEPHPLGVGNMLSVVDDVGRNVMVHDKYFVANTRVYLVGDNEVEGGFSTVPKKGDPRLSYEGVLDNVDMPNIRPNIRR